MNGANGAEQVGRTAPAGNAFIVTASVLVFITEVTLKLIPVNVTATAAGTTVKLAVVCPHRIMTV